MKQLKALLGIGVVVAGFYLAWVLIPPYYNNYSFQDEIETQARTATYATQLSEQTLKDQLAKRAKELDIPLTADEIHIDREQGFVAIWAEYTVSVETPFKTFDLKFAPATKNKKI